MTDLDFDELDKAVNNLMSTVDTTKRNPGLDDPEDTVVAITPSSDVTSSVPAAQPQASSAGVSGVSSDTTHDSSSTPAATPPLAVKRRGQFMDIMAPAKSAPTPVSRQGVSIQPSGATEAVQPVESNDSPKMPEETGIAMPDLDLESTGSAQPGVVTMPDPIDIAEKADDSHVAPEKVVETDGEPKLDNATVQVQEAGVSDDQLSSAEDTSESLPADAVTAVAESQSAVEESPLSTPFLPDAKVDKRPLGSPVTMPDPIDIGGQEKPIDEPSHESDDTSHEMPAADIVALEAEPSASTEVLTTDSSEEKNVNIEANTVDEKPVAEEQRPTGSHEAPVHAQPPAGGSIAQQYAEQPSTGDQTSGAIFDTATYHKTVEEPAKKKSSKVVTIILWVLVLIAVGAAAGAGYFYWSTR